MWGWRLNHGNLKPSLKWLSSIMYLIDIFKLSRLIIVYAIYMHSNIVLIFWNCYTEFLISCINCNYSNLKILKIYKYNFLIVLKFKFWKNVCEIHENIQIIS